jgi:hypothetical protein
MKKLRSQVNEYHDKYSLAGADAKLNPTLRHHGGGRFTYRFDRTLSNPSLEAPYDLLLYLSTQVEAAAGQPLAARDSINSYLIMNTDYYNSQRPADNLSLIEPVSAGLTLRTLLNKDSTYDIIMTFGENKALPY